MFNRLEVDVPEDWEDQTLVTFLLPPETTHSAPLTGLKPDKHRASVVIKRLTLEKPLTPEAVSEAYEHIHRHAAGGVVTNRETIELSDGRRAAIREFEIDGPEGPAKQIHIHLEVEGHVHALTGTAPADLNFAKLKKACLQIAESLRQR